MVRTVLVAEEDTAPASGLTRELLDGASLYGIQEFDAGRHLFGLWGTSEGFLSPGEGDYPRVGDVRSGVIYGGGFEGTFNVPAESDVRDGVGYGEDGAEFEGTLATGGAHGYAF